MNDAIGDSGKEVTNATQAQLQLSFASAENIASHNPQYASQITAAAQQSFLDGDRWAYTAAIVAVLAGMALVYTLFPKRDEEMELRASYHARDTQAAGARADAAPRGVSA
jgi:hypothetical protein